MISYITPQILQYTPIKYSGILPSYMIKRANRVKVEIAKENLRLHRNLVTSYKLSQSCIKHLS